MRIVNNSFFIPRCYDSHVHWVATGEIQNNYDLSSLNSKEALRQASNHMRPNRGRWILGFGWDENLWPAGTRPHLRDLDQWFPNNPVAFSRVDGHSLWVNSEALKLGEIKSEYYKKESLNEMMELDSSGCLTGVIKESVREMVFSKIPSPSSQEVEDWMIKGVNMFKASGFSHIRDVGGNLRDWTIASEIDRRGKLEIYCEMYFNLMTIDELPQIVAEIEGSQNYRSSHLRVGGLKCFYDGALGSEGAFISQAYSGGNNGYALYSDDEMEAILIQCWQKSIPVSVHTIGDEAVHKVAQIAMSVNSKGYSGSLHLEHCEIIRPESIALLKNLKVQCHMQPSHFLSDRIWLRSKLGALCDNLFPWRRLEEAGIEFYFGSDSPISMPSLSKTILAVKEAELFGILPPVKNPLHFHSHPDSSWGSKCQTKFDSNGIIELDIR